MSEWVTDKHCQWSDSGPIKIWQPIPMNTKNCNGYITTDDLREILTELDPELSRFYIHFQFLIGNHEAGSWSICTWLDLRGVRHQLAMWNCESVILLHQAGGGRYRGGGGRGQERHCGLRRVPRHDDRMMCCHFPSKIKQQDLHVIILESFCRDNTIYCGERHAPSFEADHT